MIKEFLLKIFGRKYFIKHMDSLKHDEILIFGHRIYLKKK